MKRNKHCANKIHMYFRDAWVAQLVERPTSTQVMISQSVGLSPTSGSVPTAQSLKPALQTSEERLFRLSLCPLPSSCSVSQKIYKHRGAPGWRSRLSVRLRLRS